MIALFQRQPDRMQLKLKIVRGRRHVNPIPFNQNLSEFQPFVDELVFDAGYESVLQSIAKGSAFFSTSQRKKETLHKRRISNDDNVNI